MSTTIHRVLMTIGGIAGGLGGLFALPENATLGIPPQAGAIAAIIAGACIVVANTIRANWPDVAAGTTKTTLETKTGEGGYGTLEILIGVCVILILLIVAGVITVN